MSIVEEPRLTACPSWCTEEREYHGDLHESALLHVDLGVIKDGTLYVAVSEDATEFGARPSVTVHNGDDLLLSQSPAVTRSLAAALVAAADRAEGHRS